MVILPDTSSKSFHIQWKNQFAIIRIAHFSKELLPNSIRYTICYMISSSDSVENDIDYKILLDKC